SCIPAAPHLRKEADFEGTYGVGLPPESPVFVCPADNLIPATIGKFMPSLDVERERYAEGAGNDLTAVGTGKGKSKVCIEKRRRKIQLRHPIVHHELRKERRGKNSSKNPSPAGTTFLQSKHFKSHRKDSASPNGCFAGRRISFQVSARHRQPDPSRTKMLE